MHRVPGVEIRYLACLTRNFWVQKFSTFFLDFRISIDDFFIFCHIGLGDGSKNPLSIIYQYAIIIWVIFDPIAEILGGGGQIDPPPQAEWVDLGPPSQIGLMNTNSCKINLLNFRSLWYGPQYSWESQCFVFRGLFSIFHKIYHNNLSPTGQINTLIKQKVITTNQNQNL